MEGEEEEDGWEREEREIKKGGLVRQGGGRNNYNGKGGEREIEPRCWKDIPHALVPPILLSNETAGTVVLITDMESTREIQG